MASSLNLASSIYQVLVNGPISSALQVLSGVPQGSILGPGLFVLFINDIPGTNIVLHVDDTKIRREVVHVSMGHQMKVQSFVDSIIFFSN